MKCPYCSKAVGSDIDEVSLHILEFHPDKTLLEDAKESRRARLYETAVSLTDTVFMRVLGVSKVRGFDLEEVRTDVLDTFKYFLKNLMDGGL